MSAAVVLQAKEDHYKELGRDGSAKQMAETDVHQDAAVSEGRDEQLQQMASAGAAAQARRGRDAGGTSPSQATHPGPRSPRADMGSVSGISPFAALHNLHASSRRSAQEATTNGHAGDHLATSATQNSAPPAQRPASAGCSPERLQQDDGRAEHGAGQPPKGLPSHPSSPVAGLSASRPLPNGLPRRSMTVDNSGLRLVIGSEQPALESPGAPQPRKTRFAEDPRGLRSVFEDGDGESDGAGGGTRPPLISPKSSGLWPKSPTSAAAAKWGSLSSKLLGGGGSSDGRQGSGDDEGEAGRDEDDRDVSSPTGKGKGRVLERAASAFMSTGKATGGASEVASQTPVRETSAMGSSEPSPLSAGAAASAKWNALKRRLQAGRPRAETVPTKSRASHMDLTRELQTGILPVLLLKLSFERDEQNHRRIPVLLNHLKLRVSDSINPLHNTHAGFRIELEYGDGLVKWVIYRELRDFINLHAHYRVAALSGYLGRRSGGGGEGEVALPEFPKTSLPYWNLLKREGREVGRAEFAKMQRDQLENYIIQLIRTTMFRAEANRLCKFFEISALSVALAARGGYQGKQGYLRILSRSSYKNRQPGIMNWKRARDPKWFIVRESYIVAVDEADQLQIHDVFLMDGDFTLERPKRLHKQAGSLFHFHEHKGSSGSASGEGKSDLSGAPEKSDGRDRSQGGTGNEATAEKKGIGNDDGHGHRKSGSGIDTSFLTQGALRDPPPDDDTATTDDPNKPSSNKEKDRKKKKKHVARTGAPSGHSPPEQRRDVSSHTFYVKNAERKLKLVARNERQMDQFIASIERVAARNIWSGSNRFGSFAPIRLNCTAQWLVDGRDYFWNLSRALLMAKDRIYIHDWWLSPELYLRRPGTPKYRLDNILQQKASEGVKVFVIIYNEVSNNFTPTDSNYTKQRLINLHHNIYVQRSPSHFQTGTFYWAHHEKLCVIDETIAFMGGLDLCFGRWDTSQHVLIDDEEFDREEGNRQHVDVPADEIGGQVLARPKHGKEKFIWPGKDYANERVLEWHTLHKPEQDLMDRSKYPRMPWHDVGLQLVGQPARDLCRHFIQRWNYLLRIKNHSRLMPFLLPPPDFSPRDLANLGLTGTCEAQICRSAGPWSIGTQNKVEHSIQNAYLKAIQLSEHFVYIENQFFVTSTVCEGVVIENKIGEALVDRIITAHREGTPWRAIIVIPLTPGFPLPVDHPDASSVRLIVDLQSRSICRGEHSIFAKLRREGIDPDEYINFFSLRNWGKLKGNVLTTEQVYIHGKTMVVDDRLVLIGSANINERSQRGDRDSELACIIRDTDMIDSTMAGQPYRVGRFAHTLRVRLMREHLGLDVDVLEDEEANMDMLNRHPEQQLEEEAAWDPLGEQSKLEESGDGITRIHHRNAKAEARRMVADGVGHVVRGAGSVLGDGAERKALQIDDAIHQLGSKISSKGDDNNSARGHEDSEAERIRATSTDGSGNREAGFDGTVIRTLEEKVIGENRPVNQAGPLGTKARDIELDKRQVPSPRPAHQSESHDGADAAGLDKRRDMDGLAKTENRTTTQGNGSNAINEKTMRSLGPDDEAEYHRQAAATASDRPPKGKAADVEDEEPEDDERKGSHSTQQKSSVDEVGDLASSAATRRMENASHQRNRSTSKATHISGSNTSHDDLRRKMSNKMSINPWAAPADAPVIEPHAFADPLVDEFFKDMWMASAVHNTQIFRKVFKCVPDDTVTTWQEYKVFQAWSERLARSGARDPSELRSSHGPSRAGGPSGTGDGVAGDTEHVNTEVQSESTGARARRPSEAASQAPGGNLKNSVPQPPKPGQDDGFSANELDQMEALLYELRGNLVIHPLRFLEAEDFTGNFKYPLDRIQPMPIYD